MIFDGTLNSFGFARLLKRSVIPFINKKFPFSHRIYMDNSPVHNSNLTDFFLNVYNINKMDAPPQSPVIQK